MSLRTQIIKKLVAIQMSGWAEGTIEEQRARQNRMLQYMRLPVDTQCQPVDANGVSSEWISVLDVPMLDATSSVVLYLHGGAYALGSVDIHREFISRLAGTTRTCILAINYRLAPEHPYPAALEDTLAAYQWLLDAGYASSQIVIAGDSAGGGLTLAALVALRDAGDPLPAGAVCISPMKVFGYNWAKSSGM